MNKWTAIAVVGLVLIGASVAQASDPIGIYAIVDKVVFEPNDSAPEKIQIWGTFMLAKGRGGDEYAEPVRGFLYYSLPKGKEANAKKEWADLKKLAGTDQTVAFGSRYEEKGKIRKASDKAESPDAYPMGFGMQKVSDRDGISKKLHDAKGKDTK